MSRRSNPPRTNLVRRQSRHGDPAWTARWSHVVATQFAFVPRCIPVPANRPVTIRAASPDVIHGFIVAGTNVNTMVVPGYVSEVRTEFREPGEHLMPCHEFCGLGHSEMWSMRRVVPPDELKPDGNGRVSCEIPRWHFLVLAHLIVAFGAFAIAAVFGAGQMLARSPLHAPFERPDLYFASVTAHGTLMAYVLPTLFVMGFGYFVAVTALDRPLPSLRLAWLGFGVAAVGIVMATVTILLGSSVRSLHVLPAARRQRLLLYRARPCRGRLVDLGGADDLGDERLEAGKSGTARAARHVRHRGQCGAVAVDHRWSGRRAPVPGNTRGIGMERHDRCRPFAHAVLLDAPRDRLFLADTGLHRLLHDASAGCRRPPLQRHDGAAELHPVPGLQPAGRHASSVHGSGARLRLQVPADDADGAGRGADAAHHFHDRSLARDRRQAARRERSLRLDRSAAVGEADGARGRARLRHARLRRLRRLREHELRA